MVKRCPFTGRRCFHSSCDYITAQGNVLVCSLHGNPSGRLTPRVCRSFAGVRLWYWKVVSK
jgi:hypothetical protein